MDWADEKAQEVYQQLEVCRYVGRPENYDFDLNDLEVIAQVLRSAVAEKEKEVEALQKKASLWEGDARIAKASWDAACHDIDRLQAKLASAQAENEKLRADNISDEQTLLEICEALDGLPITGERTGPRSAKHLSPIDQIKALRLELRQVKEALLQISKGEGPFSRDQLQHCSNTVETMKEIARNALADHAAGGKDGE